MNAFYVIAATLAAMAVAIAATQVLIQHAQVKAEQTRGRRDDALLPLLAKTLYIVECLAILAVGLHLLGVEIWPLIAGAGVGGLAIALAAKDLMANIFGTLVIFLDRPFELGQHIEVDGVRGTVSQIGLRSTVLTQADASTAHIPNSIFTSLRVANNSRRSARVMELEFVLSGNSIPSQVLAFEHWIVEILTSPDDVRYAWVSDMRAPSVHISQIDAQGIHMRVTIWTDTSDDTMPHAAKESAAWKLIGDYINDDLGLSFSTSTCQCRYAA